MIQYLKKRKLYELTASLVQEEFSACKEFVYRFYQGTEWLDYGSYHICSQWGGNWIRIERSNHCDDDFGDITLNKDIFARKWDGEYHYHSHNGKIIKIDNIKNTEGQNYVQSYSNSKSERWSEQDHYHSELRNRTR